MVATTTRRLKEPQKHNKNTDLVEMHGVILKEKQPTTGRKPLRRHRITTESKKYRLNTLT